jgi:hypothetical protein
MGATAYIRNDHCNPLFPTALDPLVGWEKPQETARTKALLLREKSIGRLVSGVNDELKVLTGEFR